MKKIEDFFEELTRTKKLKMKCFIKVLVKIKHIIKTNLDRATADHQILDVLTELSPCECEDGACYCELHHLDLDAENTDRNFMAAIMLQKFNSILDEKLQDKLGIKLKKQPHLRSRGVETEAVIEPPSNMPEKIRCNVCKVKDCTCVTR